MRFLSLLSPMAALLSLSASTILQNGQIRTANYPDTTIASIGSDSSTWRTYGPNATEVSYKGRWDSKHVSWWAAPGLKFGFTGQDVAITFGRFTSSGVLVAYRVDGLDWQFTNATANATHHLVSQELVPSLNSSSTPRGPRSFELRVTNWAYGVQIAGVHVSAGNQLVKMPDYSRTIEFIGDSLTSGMYSTYEAFSGFGFGIGAGFGDIEFSITAYPGICLVDANCWGNPRGQTYQWFQTSDTSPRAIEMYGNSPEQWDFAAHPSADIVVINIGTNDNNTANNVTAAQYATSYVDFVSKVHETYPQAQIILMSLWNGFSQVGTSYYQDGAFVDEIYATYKHYESEGYVHYFNSTGILQHNDIGPQYHPTDVGHVKVASHVLQYIRLKFGWELAATGPEVQHDTLYWNDQSGY